MEIIQYKKGVFLQQNSALTIGKFDGLHRGHQELLQAVCRKKEEGLQSVVVSFYDGDRKKKSILSEKKSIELLEKAGVDVLVLLPLKPEILGMEAETFIREVLVGALRAKYIVCGTDFRFGHERKGDGQLLINLSESLGFSVRVFRKLEFSGSEISSTRIREELSLGQMENANACLSEPYSIDGEIVHGRELGRKLGFPTINVYPPEEQLLPKYGVYYTRVEMDGKTYGGLANLGVKPSVTDEKRPILETHLLNASGDFYGKQVSCRLISFIRPEMKFESIEELERRVLLDISEAKKRHGDS